MEFKSSFNFNNLFVLDMANNHQGIIDHGIKIINECSKVSKKFDIRAGIKFQFRDLPNFVHSSHRKNSNNKHVPRFLSTFLDIDSYRIMLDKIRELNLIAICTPFDEKSVDNIVDLGFDLIKVASCSARDWPLLEKVADAGLPVIASTGGLKIEEVDDLVSFFSHRAVDFALMHCVSIYPTPDEACNLLDISEFKERYPGITVGWSTHENPDDIVHIGLAQALGAQMFERHVGLETESIKLNKYSSTPKQLVNWFSAYQRAQVILGQKGRKKIFSEERTSLKELSRGIYLKHDIKKSKKITKDDIYLAFPSGENQILASEFRNGYLSTGSVKKDHPLIRDSRSIDIIDNEKIIKNAIHEVKAMLAKAKVNLSPNFSTEYSHHYGIEKFNEFGAVLITVINRQYAKKIIVQLPGQSHPLHYHRLKEETFIVTSGQLKGNLDGREYILNPGETLTVFPGVWHSFSTDTGCIFEEISTTAHKNDSVYKDKRINELTNEQRKTSVDHWGRFQLSEQIGD